MNNLATKVEPPPRECCNCGAVTRLIVTPVIPFETGGRRNGSNEVVVCRDCDLLRFNVGRKSKLEEPKMLNVWLSHELHTRVMEVLDQGYGNLSTLASLTRYLVSKYLEDAELYDDLGMRQDQGMGVKVNFWMSCAMRDALKDKAAEQKLTVADVVKGLFLLFLEQVDRI